MWTPKGLVDLYFLVSLHVSTRRVWISPCAAVPNSAWVSQPARHFLQHAEDMALPVGIILRDNDTKYTRQFEAVLQGAGVQIKRNTPMSPNLRAHVERVIQTLQQEVLDFFVIVSRGHPNHICREAMEWYNRERPHSARDHLPPDRSAEFCELPTPRPGDIVCRTRLGGLLKSYSRRA